MDAGRTVFSGGLLIPMDGGPPRAGDLWIEGRRILALAVPGAAVSGAAPPASTAPGAAGSSGEGEPEIRRIDATGLWILPGFVQTHVHLCQTLFRGMAEGRELFAWLSEVIWPMEAALEPETAAVAAEAGIRQLLAGGTTAILDMGTTRHSGAILEMIARLGLRAIHGPALMDRGPAAASGLVRGGNEALAELEALATRWHGHDDGRIGLAYCPRFAPSVSPPFWAAIASGEPSFLIHTHGAETRAEVTETEALTGRTPARYLSELPARGRVKMAHGVWLTDEDRSALAGSGTAVLHCPGSNLKLGSGLADVAALRASGVAVGLGADGAACNNRLDPWAEMRAAAQIESLLHGPASVDAGRILRMATIDGAAVLGIAAETGSLAPGKRADFVILDPLDPALLGTENAGPGAPADTEGAESVASALVFAGSPALVRETWIDGRAVYKRGDSIEEWNELSRKAREARRRVRARAGIRA